MRKTRDLFGAIRDTKGTVHAKKHNKGQKLYGPKDAEDIKKRLEDYTEELYKKKILVSHKTTMV